MLYPCVIYVVNAPFMMALFSPSVSLAVWNKHMLSNMVGQDIIRTHAFQVYVLLYLLIFYLWLETEKISVQTAGCHGDKEAFLEHLGIQQLPLAHNHGTFCCSHFHLAISLFVPA